MKPLAHVMPSSMVGHCEHAAESTRLIVPKGHGRLTLVLPAQYCPAAHGVAWSAPVGQKEPAGQAFFALLLVGQK
jgi:hypothetical protein